MSETIGYSTLEVIPSVKGLAKNLDRQMSGDLASAGKKGGRKFGDAAGTEAATGFKRSLGDKLRGFNPLAGLAVGAGAFTLFRSAVDEASEAEQAIGGVGAVFGKYADQVEDASRTSAEALGLSSTAYQKLVTVSGALLKNKGLEDYAAQAQNLVTVGADLSAMFGGSTLEAVEALNAALRGESDPIERYAISLNETAVNAKLVKDGLDGLKGPALEQAKTQARLALIMEQSADAQGTFARESDTFAGKSQRLSAEFANLRKELGQELLPAMSASVGFLRDEGIPALTTAGGAAKDLAVAFGKLPAPVQTAAAAFVALKVASSVGLTPNLAGGANKAKSAIDDLRLRTMLARDEFARMRTSSMTVEKSYVQMNRASGRAASGMGALRVATQGAGAAMSRGIGSMVSAIGPANIALAAGTAALTYYWQEQQKAKARVEATKVEVKNFTSTLDENTGAVTRASRQQVSDWLSEDTKQALKDAGLGLNEVTTAVLYGGKQLDDMQAKLLRTGGGFNDFGAKGKGLAVRLSALNERVNDGQKAWELNSEAVGKAEDATGSFTDATARVSEGIGKYAGQLDNAREKIQRLMDKEDERKNKNLDAFNAQTRLAAAFDDARKSIEDNGRTLDVNTEKGRENRDALSQLAQAWNDQPEKLQNAKGAYRDMRTEMINLADQMNGSGKNGQSNRAAAQELVDTLLKLPKKKRIDINTPGMAQALAQLKRLQELAKDRSLNIQAHLDAKGIDSRPALATGGELRGPGTGTSDSILMWGSNGEFMQRKKAVDYYGVDFMHRLNNLQIPKFAGGGEITPASSAPAIAGGNNFNFNGPITFQDGRDAIKRGQRQAQRAGAGVVVF